MSPLWRMVWPVLHDQLAILMVLLHALPNQASFILLASSDGFHLHSYILFGNQDCAVDFTQSLMQVLTG